MKSPFGKLVSERGEPSAEDKEAVDTDFELLEHGIRVWTLSKDGSRDNEEILDVDPADTKASTAKYRAYRLKHGVVEESELNR